MPGDAGDGGRTLPVACHPATQKLALVKASSFIFGPIAILYLPGVVLASVCTLVAIYFCQIVLPKPDEAPSATTGIAFTRIHAN